MSANKARVVVVTGAVAAVTATGAWYGAGLKTRQEFKQERKTVVQATVDDKLAQLESSRDRLVRQKVELQKKIDQLAAKTGRGNSTEPHAQSG